MQIAKETIKSQYVQVWSEIPKNSYTIIEERENYFNNIEDATKFINGKRVKNHIGKSVKLNKDEKVVSVDMHITLNVDALVSEET